MADTPGGGLDEAILRAEVIAAVPTRSQLQATLWDALRAHGFRDWENHANQDRMVNNTPTIKELSDSVAGIIHDHIEKVIVETANKHMQHIKSESDVQVIGPDPQGGTVSSDGRVN